MGIFRALSQFFGDVKSEFKRVTWPAKEVTLQSTGVVLFLTAVIAVFLGMVDMGLSEAVKLLIK